MNQNLKIVLEADVKQLQTKLRRAERNLNDFEKAVDNGDKNLNRFSKTTKVNAVPAMTSFSQVIQDAPYGIRGVANNITQLTSQMGYLASSSGGAMGALKALGSTLMGPAGILLAISVVTSLLVSYGDELFKASDNTNKLAKATKEFLGSAMAEISNLKILIEIAEDYSNSIVTRRKAIEEINKKYGDYLGNLDEEKIKTDKVRAAVDNLTRSIIQQAQVKGLKKTIGEITEEAAGLTTELQVKQQPAFEAIRKEIDKLRKGNDFWRRVIDQGDGVVEQLAEIKKASKDLSDPELTGLKSAVGTYNEIKGKISEIEKETAKSIKPFQSLQQALQEQIFSITVVPEFSQEEVEITDKKGKRPKVKAVLDLETDGKTKTLEFSGSEAMQLGKAITDQITAFENIMKTLPAASQEYQILAEKVEFLKGVMTPLDESAAKNLESFTRLFTGIKEQSKSLDVLRMKAQLTSQMFAAFGNTLIDAFDSGENAFENFVKSFIKSASRIIIGLIAQAIGNSILAGTQSAVATGPGAAFALPGMIGAATAVTRGAFSAIPQFAHGGIVPGGSYSGDNILARLNSGEMVLNMAQQGNLFRMLNSPSHDSGIMERIPVDVYGEISGDTINLVSERANRRRNRRG